MNVNIKDFNVEMPVKSSGIEFEIRTAGDADKSTQIGDCYLTMTGLTWCKGRKAKKAGIAIEWEEFITIMTSNESVIAAIKAASVVRRN